MEIPDCRCKPEFVKLCQCQEPCDCPRWLRRCPHVSERDHKTPIAQWARMLWGAWPEEYVEPDPPEKAHGVLTHEGRVLVMAERAGDGTGAWNPDNRGLRHADDPRHERFELVGRPVTGGRADRAREREEFVTQVVGATPMEILRDWIEPFHDEWESQQCMIEPGSL